jgi:hypothetical protein
MWYLSCSDCVCTSDNPRTLAGPLPPAQVTYDPRILTFYARLGVQFDFTFVDVSEYAAPGELCSYWTVRAAHPVQGWWPRAGMIWHDMAAPPDLG